MSSDLDAIIVGAGHNGLVSAAYLARAGLKVLVLERRYIAGGVCVTEEVYPGFKYSTAAYSAGLLRPEIIRDLELAKFGLEQHPFDPQFFMPFPDSKYIFVWNDMNKSVKEIEKFSKNDAKQFVKYVKFWSEFIKIVEPMLLTAPPNLSDLVELFRDPEAQELLRSMMLRSAAEFLDENFESEYVKAALCTSCTIGTYAGPRTPGTAYVLGHLLLHEINGQKQTFGYAIGGMGGITQALSKAASHYGADIRLNAEVNNIIVKNGEAVGVTLASGKKITSRVVISNADPKRTFLKLVGAEHLDGDFVTKIEKIRLEGVASKINCAISELPDFKAYPGKGPGPQHRGYMDICPSIDYLEKAWDDAKYGRSSEHPFLDCLTQSAYDPSISSPGKHVLSIFAQYSPYHLRDGAWDERREEFGDRVIDTLSEYAPNIKKAVLHRQVITPLDLERDFRLTEGNIYHMEMTPDQILSFRPVPGWSRYRTPIKRLYLCGAGAHPGGGVMGAPGHNAAMAVLDDMKKQTV